VKFQYQMGDLYHPIFVVPPPLTLSSYSPLPSQFPCITVPCSANIFKICYGVPHFPFPTVLTTTNIPSLFSPLSPLCAPLANYCLFFDLPSKFQPLFSPPFDTTFFHMSPSPLYLSISVAIIASPHPSNSYSNVL